MALAWVKHKWFGENEKVFCHWCQKELNLRGGPQTNPSYCTVDHLVEKALGGTSKEENLVPSCPRCNTERSSHLQLEAQHEDTLADVEFNKNVKEKK